ncbi:Hypothetical_protein [Hexamita inflata]|uniref:Hypothetical_protein n=1 Tax=Hexamita inflata TaxID=28002 RepID=A0AA86RV40_9EUKA|nr:Hypothetical protein HINF_LOCUS66247 [Hexamita inflata]
MLEFLQSLEELETLEPVLLQAILSNANKNCQYYYKSGTCSETTAFIAGTLYHYVIQSQRTFTFTTKMKEKLIQCFTDHLKHYTTKTKLQLRWKNILNILYFLSSLLTFFIKVFLVLQKLTLRSQYYLQISSTLLFCKKKHFISGDKVRISEDCTLHTPKS